MDWSNALSGILQKYAGAGGGAVPASASPHDDFQEVARNAPQEVTSAAVEQAFRSDQTPPFSQMVSHLFTHADGPGRATLLNQLLGQVSPGALASVPGLSILPAMLRGTRQVTPEQAGQVPPEEVEHIAASAERENPGIITEVSHFVTEHPDLVKGLGGLALSIAMQHIARRS